MSAMTGRKRKEIWEFGDFQTPAALATSACKVLKRIGVKPTCILEPTCGRGAFISAAAHAFPTASRLVGVDINPQHLNHARDRLALDIRAGRVELREGNFFKFDWEAVLRNCQGSWLVVGNPPWVTSAELGMLTSKNLPKKSNFHGRSGIEALTGKSNFDISEWMMLRHLEWLRERGGWIAMLLKTVVARKILALAWKARYPVKAAALYQIDAMKQFGAAVDAGLFVLHVEPGEASFDCAVFDDLDDATPSRRFGFHDGIVIADVDTYSRWRHLSGPEPHYLWRSGIKHDCAKVMELTAENGHYRNGLGEEVTIEEDFIYPLLKSSEVYRKSRGRNRFMLVTQRKIGDDTNRVRIEAPRTWAYLQRHASILSRRGSTIYRNRPPFSIFGVGDYSFAAWKVAISGFYKELRFVPVGPEASRPVVFDDTVYFLACRSQAEAELLVDLLNAPPAQEFYGSMIFWSDKRPITGEILKRLNLAKLATEIGRSEEYHYFVRGQSICSCKERQLSMFETA